MSIEGGEFIRDKDAVEKEKGVNEQIFDICSGIKIQNNHPSFSQQPSDVFYWKAERLENVKQGLETLEKLVSENSVSEVVNPFNSEEIVDVQEFVAKVKKSIEYSEQVAEQIKNQPPVSEEELSKRRAEMKRRLLGEE